MFQVGRVYSRVDDLQAKYGGQRMGGAMTPKGKPYIFLLPTDHGRETGYTEHWQGDVLHMSGSGRSGDQEMKGLNRATRDHEADDKALYLFWPVSNNAGQYRYQGKVRYIGHYFRQRAGADGEPRREIVFKLQSVPE